jgi:hypothetical protein
MSGIAFNGDTVEIDAAIVAEAWGISPEALRVAMRAGNITTKCERGLDDDAGTFRVSFIASNRRLRLVVDAAGNVVRRSRLTVADPPGGDPPDLRRFTHRAAKATLPG